MASELTVEILVSVDGWAGSDGLPGYFGYLGPELEAKFAAELAKPQVLIMGRRTYDILAGLPDEAKDDSWERMSQLDTVVFSRTLEQAAWPNTRICREDLIEEIRRLKAGDVPLRLQGSLSLVRQLLAAREVDRLRLLIFPLIAGKSGREWFFADLAAADLELVDSQVLDGRILMVDYRPTGNDIPRA